MEWTFEGIIKDLAGVLSPYKMPSTVVRSSIPLSKKSKNPHLPIKIKIYQTKPKMKFLFVIASATLLFLSIAMPSARAYSSYPQLAPEFQYLLDSIVEVSVDKSLRGDERIEKLRALVLPLFIYADANQVEC